MEPGKKKLENHIIMIMVKKLVNDIYDENYKLIYKHNYNSNGNLNRDCYGFIDSKMIYHNKYVGGNDITSTFNNLYYSFVRMTHKNNHNYESYLTKKIYLTIQNMKRNILIGH